MNELTVRIQKIHEHAIMPKYVHEGDSGMDLFSVAEHVLKPGERVLIGTGLKVAVPLGYEGQVRPKSGLALKHGVTVVNTPGTLDAGYRGELGVIAINHGTDNYTVEKNQKVAQLVINKIEIVGLEEVQDLEDTARGAGGFGSTGLKV
ncbi:dUTP diphosphatase [Nanoarchaeota archaeon]